MTSFIGNHGIVAIFILMAIAGVLPAFSELTMLYGGALASGALVGHVGIFGHHFGSGISAYIAVVIAGLAGNVAGAVGGWAIGFYGGRPLLERHGRLLHASPERVERAERWFARFGPVAVPLGFAVPLVRSFVAIPAGFSEMRLARFAPLAAGGIGAFCTALAAIGWAVGASWNNAHHDLKYVDFAVVAGIVVLAAYLILRRRRSITMARSASNSSR